MEDDEIVLDVGAAKARMAAGTPADGQHRDIYKKGITKFDTDAIEIVNKFLLKHVKYYEENKESKQSFNKKSNEKLFQQLQDVTSSASELG